MIITKDLIESLRSKQGGHKASVLKLLGVKWPPKKGWSKRIIGNHISEKDYKLAFDKKDLKASKKETKTNNASPPVDHNLLLKMAELKERLTLAEQAIDILNNEVFPK